MKSYLQEFRKKKNITQQELAKIVNVSRQAIIAIEKGKYDPSLWLAYDLANFFGVSIEEIFDFKESVRK